MPTRADVVATTRAWLGTPYKHQASVKGIGADCLGLVRGVWRELYGAEPEAVPPYAADWAETTGEEALAFAARRHLQEIAIDDAGPGNVLLFRLRKDCAAKHAAILVEPFRMIHAYSGHAVAESWLSYWWERRRAYAFRFPGVD